VFFLGGLSLQRKTRSDRPTDTKRSVGRSRSTCWPPLIYGNSFFHFKQQVFEAKLFGANLEIILTKGHNL